MPRRSPSAECSVTGTRRLLAQNAAAAVGVLVALMQDEEQKPELRMKAAESILDRVCGKAGSSKENSEPQGVLAVRFEGVLEEWSR